MPGSEHVDGFHDQTQEDHGDAQDDEDVGQVEVGPVGELEEVGDVAVTGEPLDDVPQAAPDDQCRRLCRRGPARRSM